DHAMTTTRATGSPAPAVRTCPSCGAPLPRMLRSCPRCRDRAPAPPVTCASTPPTTRASTPPAPAPTAAGPSTLPPTITSRPRPRPPRGRRRPHLHPLLPEGGRPVEARSSRLGRALTRAAAAFLAVAAWLAAPRVAAADDDDRSSWRDGRYVDIVLREDVKV